MTSGDRHPAGGQGLRRASGRCRTFGRRGRFAWLIAAAMVVPGIVPAAAAQEVRAVTSTIQVAGGEHVRAAGLGDVNGDGLDDLVIGIRRAGQRPRALLVHYRSRSGVPFRSTPDLRLDLTPDVVCFAIGDVHTDRGEEVVLLAATGAFSWRPHAGEEQRFVRLAPCELLWQFPDRGQLFQWGPGVRDVDGDGLVDLVVPEPAGYRILRQRRADGQAHWDRADVLELPPRPLERDPASLIRVLPSGAGSRIELNLPASLEGFAELRDPLLEIVESVPSPHLADFDADGDLDLLAQTSTELLAWLQAGGSFEREPRHRLMLPLIADRQRRLDLSYSAHAADLDRDGRADYVILAGDPLAARPATQVRWYLQAAAAEGAEATLFAAGAQPAGTLVLPGFVAAPDLTDVNGDALPDLVVATFRPDMRDRLGGDSSGSLEAQLLVFVNGGRGFGREPEVRYPIRLSTRGFDFAGTSGLAARFIGDVTGDGLGEILIRSEPDRLRLHRLAGGPDRVVIQADPSWEMRISRRADLKLGRSSRGLPPAVLVIEDTQVSHVELTR